MRTTVHDCTLLMPDGRPDEAATIAAVAATLSSVESDVNDADAKNQLYALLRERTRCGSAVLEKYSVRRMRNRKLMNGQ